MSLLIIVNYQISSIIILSCTHSYGNVVLFYFGSKPNRKINPALITIVFNIPVKTLLLENITLHYINKGDCIPLIKFHSGNAMHL